MSISRPQISLEVLFNFESHLFPTGKCQRHSQHRPQISRAGQNTKFQVNLLFRDSKQAHFHDLFFPHIQYYSSHRPWQVNFGWPAVGIRWCHRQPLFHQPEDPRQPQSGKRSGHHCQSTDSLGHLQGKRYPSRTLGQLKKKWFRLGTVYTYFNFFTIFIELLNIKSCK